MPVPGRVPAVGPKSGALIPPVPVPPVPVPSGDAVPSGEHEPVRPSWRCTVDGFRWPCPQSRVVLREVFGGDWTALQRRLLLVVAVAECELPGVTNADLYRRFVAWAMSPEEVCRVCGSSRHAVVSGVPPRLVPCDRLRHVVTGERA